MLVADASARAARLFWISAPLLAIALWTEPAHAYTWMIKHGYGGCVTCHADPSGGELLTPYGRVQSDLILRMRYGKDRVSAAASEQGEGGSFDSFDSFDTDSGGEEAKPKAAEEPEAAAPAEGGGGGPSDSSGFLWGLFEPPEWMLLGGSIRVASTYKDSEYDPFPMQGDLYGQLQFGAFRAEGSIGVARVDVGSPHARAAQVTTNQGKEFNLISRTHWLALDLGDGRYTVRAGRINLPFGVRIPEHTMWVRDATQTDRESDQQHGVALAYNGSWLRAEIMGIAGNYQINPDKFRERGYSLYLEALASDDLALGVSSLLTSAQSDRLFLDEETTVRQAHGVLARAALTREVVVLFEGDALLRSRRDTGYVGFLQADLEFVQGLHFMLTGEVLDIGTQSGAQPSPGQGEPRLGGWISVDWFFLPHMEARIDAIIRQEDPFTLLSQLHVFL
jgi:hypothetical protein